VTDMPISQLVERTGVAEGTLRMWERRHGFPSARRLANGHRRYRETDVELVRRVVSERSAGMSLSAAVARVKSATATPRASVFAALRRQRPDLESITLRKPVLLALTRAIEDESLSRAESPLLFGSFQSERFYRQEEKRWRELSRGADLTIAFADFRRLRTPRHGAVEIPVGSPHPLSREWTVICCAAGHAVCLTAWEPPASATGPPGHRTFESIWSVEPGVVWEAARVCAGIVSAKRPALAHRLRVRLQADPAPAADQQLKLATAITNRTLSFLF